MRVRSAAALAVLSVLGCKPGVRGLCGSTADCRKGAYCSLDGICLASSGTCSPACGDGQICSGSTCAALKPTISVQAPSGPISPAFPQIAVHVDAAPAIALHGVSVEVDSGAGSVASGSLDAPQPGDNSITLSQITAGTAAAVTVRATLRYRASGAAEATVSSAPVPATIDSAPPSVSVFVPAASDAVNGWVSRTSVTLEVRATVDDGAGSGAQSATLSFDNCPAAAACTYTGKAISQAGGATVFSFPVPRMAQAAGSEAPLPVTVTAFDVAGNQAEGSGTLQIDDAPPQIGALIYVSAGGVAGEDGNTWFVGGTGAPDVEIAVPVTDAGAGFGTLKLHLDPTDLPNFSGTLDPPGTQAADGVHFRLPASAIKNKEQHLRFTLTASDLLQHTVFIAPGDPRTMIWVDDLAPTIVAAPSVDYATATSPPPDCSTDIGNSFKCGRQSGTHLLPDDTVTVRYDAYDCGAGMAAAQPNASVSTASTQHTAPVANGGDGGSQCNNGNKAHHYSFTLNLVTQALTFDPPDQTGTTVVQLAAHALDRLQHAATLGSGGANSGAGTAPISLWRWRVKLSSAVASGSPALLPGTPGSRTVVLGTAQSGVTNLFAVAPDGTQPWSATLAPDVIGDVAVGQSGTVYASTDASCGATPACTAVNAVQPPTAGMTSASAVQCSAASANFGAPPAVATSSGSDLLYAIALSHGATGSNLFAFTPGGTACTLSTGLVVGTTDATGVSTGASAVFVSNGAGFTSLDQSGSGFGTQVSYQGSAVTTKAPPSISTSSKAGGAIFGTGGSDQKLRRTTRQPGCGPGGLTACWQTAAGFPQNPSTPPSNLNFTPVFDGSTIWTIDDQGLVFTWAQLDGTVGPFLDLTEVASPPVLVQGGAALVTTNSGLLKLITTSGTALAQERLVDVSGGLNFGGKVPAPVLDCRTPGCTGAVAYVPAPAGWLWAVQLPAAPVTAGPTVWPRPGHDSCNTRNGAETWCP